MRKSTARRYKQRRLLAALVLLAAVAALGVWLYNSGLVPITGVRVTGLRHLTSTEVVDLSGVRTGKTSLLKVPYGRIDAGIRRSAWVKEVLVTRDWVNRTLIIRVVERRPVVVIRHDSSFFAVDDEGVIVAKLEDLSRVPWPELTGVKLSDSREGEELRSKTLAAALTCLGSLSSDLRKTINGVAAAGPDEITFFSNVAGEIAFGGPTQLALKNRVIDKILADQPGRLSSLDVRVPTNPVIRPFGR